jgi:anti-anti-sigma regulatory factor
MRIIDTGAGFCLTARKADDVMSWKVIGDLDLFCSNHLREAVEVSVQAGCLFHTVDLTQATSLDASGIHDLINLHKLLGSGGELRVHAVRSCQPGRLLASTGASRILHVEYQA